MKLENLLENKKSKIHFIGIGGVSMSSLAKLLKHDGHEISGSDMNLSTNVKELKNLGIEVYLEHSEANIKDYDLVVYTAAIDKKNPELVKAFDSGILTIERCVLLGEMMNHYKFPINVAGTHGKTTTTSMLSSVFLEADLQPTISVGGDFDKIGGNLHIGSKDYFICEACEYVESFLKFFPYATIILNIEEDHLDYFRDIEHIKSSFLKFANKTDQDGFVLLNGDDQNCMAIKDAIQMKTYTFGLSKNCDLYAKNISYSIEGYPTFQVFYQGEHLGEIALGVRGEHNIKNALAVILCAYLFKIDFSAVKLGLLHFGGAKRRFEFKGEKNGVQIFDDYAHHPTEIAATLSSLSKIDYNQLYIIFQPHTYTRTKALLNDFAHVFQNVKTLIVADIYAAREKNIYGITSKDLTDKIEGALYMDSFGKIESYLKEHLKSGDLVITVGAGNVYTIGENLLK